MPKILLFLVLFSTAWVAQGQEPAKAKALEAFQAADYPLALEWLHQAKKENPNDADVWYYLGYFSHYLVYDSRPFAQQGMEWSQQQVIANLEKALQLDPSMGNARYFLGVEHISRAWEYLKQGNKKQFEEEYQRAYDKGGLPPWMIEEGRNQLRACPADAILFINGDLYHNAITWLQAIEGYRTDVSVVTLALLHRPWHMKRYRDGLPGLNRPVPLSWSDEQLGAVRNYKWRPREISIPIPGQLNSKYRVDASEDTLQWLIEPDLISPSRATFLSPGMAAFLDILEQNQWQRPVFLSMGLVTSLPVEKYRRQVGPLVQLLPFDTKQHQLAMDAEATHDFYFNDQHFKDFHTLANQDFPRVSGVMFNHHIVLLTLCRHYTNQQQWDLALQALHQIDILFPSHILPVSDELRQFMNELEQDILEQKDEQI